MHGQPLKQQSTIRQIKVHNALAYSMINFTMTVEYLVSHIAIKTRER